MADWIEIGAENDIPAGDRKCFNVDGKALCAVNVGGQVAVIENVCPHAGLPLGDGDVTGSVITCPYHGYAYDVKTGKNVDFPDDIPVTTYPVKIEGAKVFVSLNS